MSLATSKLSMLSLPPEIIREIDATLYLPMHKQPSTLTLLDGSVPSMPNKEGQHQEQRKELSDLVSFASTCKRIRCSLAPQLFHGMRLWQWEKVKLLNEAWWLTYIRTLDIIFSDDTLMEHQLDQEAAQHQAQLLYRSFFYKMPNLEHLSLDIDPLSRPVVCALLDVANGVQPAFLPGDDSQLPERTFLPRLKSFMVKTIASPDLEYPGGYLIPVLKKMTSLKYFDLGVYGINHSICDIIAAVSSQLIKLVVHGKLHCSVPSLWRCIADHQSSLRAFDSFTDGLYGILDESGIVSPNDLLRLRDLQFSHAWIPLVVPGLPLENIVKKVAVQLPSLLVATIGMQRWGIWRSKVPAKKKKEEEVEQANQGGIQIQVLPYQSGDLTALPADPPALPAAGDHTDEEQDLPPWPPARIHM